MNNFDIKGDGNITYVTTNVAITNNDSFNNSSRSAHVGGCALALAVVGVLFVAVPWLACNGMLGEVVRIFY